jgi:hypothetical protein
MMVHGVGIPFTSVAWKLRGNDNVTAIDVRKSTALDSILF